MPEELQAPSQPAQPDPPQPGTTPTPAAPPAGALNTDIPAAEPVMIPKERFDQINNELKALKAEQEKAAKAAEEARRKQLEEQSEFKKLYEAEQKKAAEAEAKATRIERERLQLEVATAGGYPTLWNRLQGETKEEMEADLKALLAAFPEKQPAAPDINAGAGGTNRKGAPTEREIRETAARLGVSPVHLAEQYGLKLSQP